ncbi:MFS transporter [Verminephrobacter aporrectodeae subsp. tuberculatae]|nr:MFS transporter [Verminephrobacter aporrectodeae]MCW5220460.1 MFS transporter [Verminephrobacter aporrectodeae subsp. tuberculatae]MCW5255585.1 MFS transporter [Verminephrobacter aporrectodeae subsp. tuberculatae]MCW5289756.1 MFS transporter [Verminephrobacter aporrectodeae subsp. tuberculatae]MCW8167283.1 MFS transporter [Verminephrobacter aporrectodeae subsp. tuberculatae]MCW8171529.1 MFS transporter [Verminephrobacter aporrectodeae subsp. tuberculatae]
MGLLTSRAGFRLAPIRLRPLANFQRLLASSCLTASGAICIPLLVIGMPGASVSWLGVVTVALVAPQACVGLVAGALADRRDRLRLVAIADGVRALIFVAIAVASFYAHLSLPVFIALAFASGCCDALAAAGYSAALADVVPRERLALANAWIASASVYAGLVGPVAAGAGLLRFSAGTVLLVNAICFAASGAFLWRRRASEVEAPAHTSHKTATLSHVAEGLTYA